MCQRFLRVPFTIFFVLRFLMIKDASCEIDLLINKTDSRTRRRDDIFQEKRLGIIRANNAVDDNGTCLH